MHLSIPIFVRAWENRPALEYVARTVASFVGQVYTNYKSMPLTDSKLYTRYYRSVCFDPVDNFMYAIDSCCVYCRRTDRAGWPQVIKVRLGSAGLHVVRAHARLPYIFVGGMTTEFSVPKLQLYLLDRKTLQVKCHKKMDMRTKDEWPTGWVRVQADLHPTHNRVAVVCMSGLLILRLEDLCCLKVMNLRAKDVEYLHDLLFVVQQCGTVRVVDNKYARTTLRNNSAPICTPMHGMTGSVYCSLALADKVRVWRHKDWTRSYKLESAARGGYMTCMHAVLPLMLVVRSTVTNSVVIRAIHTESARCVSAVELTDRSCDMGTVSFHPRLPLYIILRAGHFQVHNVASCLKSRDSTV